MSLRGSIFNILIICILGCMALTGCSLGEPAPFCAENKAVAVSGRELPAEALVPGMVRMKVSEELSRMMDIRMDAEGRIESTGVRSLDDMVSELGVTRMERTFPYAGEFEARTRAEGLHLWYDVVFDPQAVLTRAGEGFASIEGVTKVELRPRITFSSDYSVRYADIASVETKASEASQVFNDLGLSKQWHYCNDGSFSDTAKAGADVNVLPVWKKGITGNSDVIVCVVDMGVDFSHEDLADNMWSGVDDYGNEIHGYNFINDNYVLVPGDHGTHIAGTIAAVNNNGIGVAGIAGGDKVAGVPGVKIMSCQIASGNDFVYEGGAAIKWSADHGAVISQNSWQYAMGRYTDIMDSDRDGIDYFIKYAGMDADGRQTGPMAGGVVFFAGGNSSVDMAYPQSYEKVIAVSGIRSDYAPAAYNNFGSWIDLAAPGGQISFLDKANKYYTDQYEGDGIYSTLPPNAEGVAYGFMAGTSMACPHAAGVAALIVSHLGGPGFTNEELKFRLFTTATSIDEYTSSRVGEFGKGLIDAEKAIFGTSEEGPAAVTDFKADGRSNYIDYSFTVSAKSAYAYLLVSESEISDETYRSSEFQVLDLRSVNAGGRYEGLYVSEEFDTEFYMAVLLEDADGNLSRVSNAVKVAVGENHAPVITPIDGDDLTLSIYDRFTYRFLIQDEDGHAVEVSDEDMPGVAFYDYNPAKNDTLYLTINGKAAKEGIYSFKLIAEDEYGMISEKRVSYMIVSEPVEPGGPEEPEVPGEGGNEEELPIEIYPNPVKDFLYLESEEGELDAQVILYSATGAVLKNVEKKIGGGVPMDMRELPAGVYTLKVIYGDRVAVKNVAKI